LTAYLLAEGLLISTAQDRINSTASTRNTASTAEDILVDSSNKIERINRQQQQRQETRPIASPTAAERQDRSY
jgi:membrane protein involved in colicin uptake